jgi:uncharacterized membrane protein
VNALLVFVTLLATCVWIGGFVAIGVVARVARRGLEPSARVAFFRALGRSYGVVGVAALAVAYAGGAVLLARRDWGGGSLAAVLVAAALVLALGAGIRQARGMTRLRGQALREPEDAVLAARVRRGAVWATVLRAGIGLLSLALLALAAALAA